MCYCTRTQQHEHQLLHFSLEKSLFHVLRPLVHSIKVTNLMKYPYPNILELGFAVSSGLLGGDGFPPAIIFCITVVAFPSAHLSLGALVVLQDGLEWLPLPPFLPHLPPPQALASATTVPPWVSAIVYVHWGRVVSTVGLCRRSGALESGPPLVAAAVFVVPNSFHMYMHIVFFVGGVGSSNQNEGQKSLSPPRGPLRDHGRGIPLFVTYVAVDGFGRPLEKKSRRENTCQIQEKKRRGRPNPGDGQIKDHLRMANRVNIFPFPLRFSLDPSPAPSPEPSSAPIEDLPLLLTVTEEVHRRRLAQCTPVEVIAAMSWADVHTYGELLSGRGDLSTLGSFTHMFALGQSSRSTLAEEAPRQRMCSLFSQGECIEAGGGSVSVDPVERLVALGQTGTQDNEDADVFQSDNSDEDIDVLLTNEANDDFDDDGHEDPNIGEPLHVNPHIPFFTNLVGADDVIGDRDLYNGCPTWSDVTPEFAKGIVFKDKDAVIRACNCHNCPWKLRACLKKQHGFFEISQYPGPHTCLHGMKSLDHRNINSTFIAHLIKTQIAEDPGWKIASIVENIKNHSGFTVSYKKAWLGRTKAIAMVFGDWRLGFILRKVAQSAARAYRALCNEDPMKWTLAYDGGYRWGVTTTNDSECYNNVLRGARDLPITSCVEVTLYRLVATFNDKRRQIESALAKGLRYTSKVQDKLEEYQARSAGHHVTICNWASGSAEVVTSAAGITGNHKHAVMDVYAHVYDTSFEPMVHEHYWAAYDGPKIIPHPSRRRDPTSGRPTKRIHNEMDVSRKRQHNHCGICKAQGHVRRLMDTVGSLGPIDDTILTLQSHHRSTWIWEHGGTDALACRRCGTGLYDRELDPRVLQYVLRAGFYGVHRLGPIRLDHALITAFVERWRPETHTFHLPIGEASITLQDVAILLGLPIDGAPITHPQTFVTVHECQDICMHAFGVIPPAEDIDRGRLRMSWLRRTFDVLPEHADDVSVQRHARAYILSTYWGILFTDYSQTLVRVAYLPFLLDLDAAGACSWGSAVLAMLLYRSMCRATKIGQRQIVGALLLLQIWACERFSRMCPYRVDDHTTGQQPLLIGGLQFPGGPWELDGDLDFARPLLPPMSSEFTEISWTVSDLTSSHGGRTMISCMSFLIIVGLRVIYGQFGLRQIIPVAANTSPELHGIDMRGRARTDWTQLHGEYIDHWHHRREYLVVGVIDAAAMRYDDPYMVWYRRITRTLVGSPAHRPTSGYVEIGSTIEIATRYIAAIHDRIDRAIYAYDRPESLQDMYDARDMCSRSLHALREHERIGQPGVPEPPPTIPPAVPAASPAMPPAFAVHPPPSMSSSQQGQMEIPVSVEGVSQITQVELQRRPEPEPEPQPQPQPQPQPHRLGTLTHVFSRRPRPSRDRRPPRCGTGGHV
ncbi:hypothetical protein Acr_19g0003780 [Actinidia rufa]|uniref:Aminotransferase-like plant mobile domain-containing protein n=1 Tax=Actinidia rufa TaxID=165716 RepID=A0A7J0G9L2_9ERIC|nr:hypothetical protein Acr_19g0003780 [Actinidia rufa]